MNHKAKVVISTRVHAEVLQFLRAHAVVISNQLDGPLPYGELLRRTQNADALLAFMSDRIDERFLSRCSHLRVISAGLKGWDNFDVEGCTRHGVWFCVVERLLGAPTAELAIGLMLALARRIHEGDTLIRSGKFNGWQPTLFGLSLHGATIGIIGLGEVGREIARRLRGFGAHLLYSDIRRLPPSTEAKLHVKCVSRSELLRRSDFIVPLLPLCRSTFHLIDDSAIRTMKRGACIVNVGRGSIVNERAVARALAVGRLCGYAADVFEMEDWSRPRRPGRIPKALLSHPRTLFTPHLGTAVGTVRQAIEMRAAQSIVDLLSGRRPRGAINAL